MVKAKFETDSGEKIEFTGKDMVLAVGFIESDDQEGQICIMTDKSIKSISVLAALEELTEHTLEKILAGNHNQTVLHINDLIGALKEYQNTYIKQHMKELVREMAGTGEDKDGD